MWIVAALAAVVVIVVVLGWAYVHCKLDGILPSHLQRQKCGEAQPKMVAMN